MNPQILKLLLRGGKISMPDRIELGLWPYLPMSEKVFSNPEEAAAHPLKWDLHPPGDLDAGRAIE